MPTPILNLDTAFQLDIIGVYEGSSFQFSLERFEDDETTPEDWPVADYEFGVGAKQEGPAVVLLTSLAGNITRVENVLTVTCLKTENILTGNATGKTYYYDLFSDFGSGLNQEEGKGSFTVLKSVTK